MKTQILGGIIAACLAAPASAAVLDFIEFANYNEQGVVSGTAITSSAFDGETITFSANKTFFPYFDHGGAGLGVCKSVANPGTTAVNGTGNRCTSGAGDDNVTLTELVTISWSGQRTLSEILFTGEWHSLTNPQYLHLEPAGPGDRQRSDNTLLFGTSATGNTLTRYTFGQLSNMSLADITSATFAFDDASFDSIFQINANGLTRKADQFYLASALLSQVPVPASLPLLVAGLGAFACTARRRKAARA